MLNELIIERNRFFLIYKDKEEVKERVIYYLRPNRGNIVNITKYAKSEGADYICYRYKYHNDNIISIFSTTGNCNYIAIINDKDFSDNLKECVMNAVNREIEFEKKLDREIREVRHREIIKSLKQDKLTEYDKELAMKRYYYRTHSRLKSKD